LGAVELAKFPAPEPFPSWDVQTANMGIHLYIEDIKAKTEVVIPFLSVHLLACYKITKKVELSHFLNFHRMEWESGQAVRKGHLKVLSAKKPQKKFIEFIISHYRWAGNCAFEAEVAKSGRMLTAIRMMEDEIIRHAYFGMTPVRVSQILAAFTEGIHFAYTG
jgi:hypothetical protein